MWSRDLAARPRVSYLWLLLPQVTIDLGPSLLGKDEVEGLVGSLEATWDADAYHVFDKNCVHFSDALAARVSEGGLPQPLVQGVLDVAERMLDSK